MKILQCFFVILLLIKSVYADNSGIIAVVDDEPITQYDLTNRKKLLKLFGNTEALSIQNFNKLALQSLIDDQILLNYANKNKIVISDKEVNDSLVIVENRMNLPTGDLIKLIKYHNIDLSAFKKQILVELIKSNILSDISKFIEVTPKELENLVVTTGTKKAIIDAKLFVAKENNQKAMNNMQKLNQKLQSMQCFNNIPATLYTPFAELEEINHKLITELPKEIGSIIKDLSINSASTVFNHENKLKIVLLCSKKIEGITDAENQHIMNFLNQKKMSQKAQKFLGDIKKKAYVKIYH